MHELALAESIVAIGRAHAAGRRVTAVEVRVGQLRQVVPSALAFAFELVAQGTELEGAELELLDDAAEVRCRGCGAATRLTGFPAACAACGGLDVDVVGGDALLVESLELDEPASAGRSGPDGALATSAKGGRDGH